MLTPKYSLKGRWFQFPDVLLANKWIYLVDPLLALPWSVLTGRFHGFFWQIGLFNSSKIIRREFFCLHCFYNLILPTLASRAVDRLLRSELDLHVWPDARASQCRKDRCPDRTQRLRKKHLLEAGRPHSVPRAPGQFRSGRIGRTAASGRHLHQVSVTFDTE